LKAEVIRMSDLAMDAIAPAAEMILKAKGMPSDAKIVHVIPTQLSIGDQEHVSHWEILVASESFPDRSIAEMAKMPSYCPQW
jgi:hypothetical protein